METEAKIKIQNEIMTLLDKDNSSRCTFHFDLIKSEPSQKRMVHLLLISFNPKTSSSFLLHDVKDKTEEMCYEKMLEFIKELPRSKDIVHYQIEWYHKENLNNMRVSYFFGHSPFDALRKFYSLENKDNIVFYSMQVKPIS